ncbi:MAG: FAD-dependent oxidoreductase [Candidatus Eremiobacteraeota bacterium]|nr:FAD-dependent oxidoreductase [Candidatus Eremiobacteraeota bacterium]
MEYEVIVIGGGMAGMSAAMFLGRAGVSVGVFDQGESSLRRVSRVNNYPGFPGGIAGQALLESCRTQASQSGADVFDARVESVGTRSPGFVVNAAAAAYPCEYLVLASNKRTDLAQALGLTLGGFGSRFVGVDGRGETAAAGCYAAGRITGLPSQAVISAGDGAKTALAIIERIRGGYYVDHDV